MKPQEASAVTPQAKPVQETSPGSGLISMEIEHNIPVKQPDAPGGTSPSPNIAGSVVPAKQFVEESGASDKELDSILKDVSRDVKKLGKTSSNGRKLSLKNWLPKKSKAKTAVEDPQLEAKTKKPALIIASALVVGAVLVAAAVYAFRQGQSANSKVSSRTVGTSAAASKTAQTNSGILITPGDIADFGSSLQSKIDQLNDTQDFNSQSLSDQSLGL